MTRYLFGSFAPAQRQLIVVAAVLLLPVFFLPMLPIWHLYMVAPQYPEGLTLHIFTNTIRGDLDKINILNHYVGMKAITPGDFGEFSYMPQALTLFGVAALAAALFGRRWLAIAGWLAFTGFAAVMFNSYVQWLYRYGHDLDPRAAIKLQTFMPPVIGFQRMANFRVWSIPGIGTWILGFAWLLGPAILWLERRAPAAADEGRATAAPDAA